MISLMVRLPSSVESTPGFESLSMLIGEKEKRFYQKKRLRS